jgi:hypothetical protein
MLKQSWADFQSEVAWRWPGPEEKMVGRPMPSGLWGCTRRSHHAHGALGGATSGGSPVGYALRSGRCEHKRVARKVPCKGRRWRGSPSSRTVVRGWSSGSAAAPRGGGGRLVVGEDFGEVMWLGEEERGLAPVKSGRKRRGAVLIIKGQW